ncbi:MAG: nicotinate-nucleotide adenylyltransferase [Bacteroidetes bacterium]|jgi:nicotinate-nucleotide adenylyltransferase|nr:nicotinate-nucleotide adenylyltransferase [Bacteroidota bacterium]MDF2450970.1 nicotinate-nucleotide adenylyltransferase [Bacteroidota bacterium]
MHIGLFFGSFNPVHVGHMVLANYMASFTELEQVWFIVSPHNPLKEKSSLLDQNQRLHMVNLAIGDSNQLKSNNIEFGLPQPSYTINTLAHLKEKYPQHRFSLIMGEDNLESFSKWKNYEEILKNHFLFVYPRPGCNPGELKNHKSVMMTNAPVMELSSTMIRQSIKSKKDVSFFVPRAVWEYLDEMHFYKK